MKQFIKENWFKLIVASAILIIAIAIGYYFIIYLPKEKVIKEELANQIKCQQDGMELYKSQVKEAGQNISFGNPEFRFSKKLKTCLYKNMYIAVSSVSYFITDVYTNKDIINWFQVKGDGIGEWNDLEGSEKNWKLKVKELFEE